MRRDEREIIEAKTGIKGTTKGLQITEMIIVKTFCKRWERTSEKENLRKKRWKEIRNEKNIGNAEY